MTVNRARRTTIVAAISLFMLMPAVGFSAAQPTEFPSYASDIQPIFDRYCVACHACFDAPCQLNLTQAEGVTRGASKSPVYDGTRIKAANPSRLGIDASSDKAWRKKGFYSVTDHSAGPSILMSMLEAGFANKLVANSSLPQDVDISLGRENACPDQSEIDTVLEAQPHLGMPFAIASLPADDLATLRTWLRQGAKTTPTRVSPSIEEQRQIDTWESWLNAPQPKRQLVARWLYEHWTFARLHFDELKNSQYFRLVRSRTPSGEPVDEIATRHPNSPTNEPFFYRFAVQGGTRVYKTHIRFALNRSTLRHIDELFITPDWRITQLPGYTADERANPFSTFAPIPAQARYRFMLENAEYFVRTFIRGPVCRGQLATDVIRDHFWVMFQDPEADPYLTEPEYRNKVDPLLALPGLEDDLLKGAERWFESNKGRNQYTKIRQQRLAKLNKNGAAIGDIWDGDGYNDNAMLTVFRHHDSATVKRGWLEQQPLTAWWMDYPLFERSYYNLVVNFDVFGNVSHQAQTRLYFDLIRNGSEQNFLRLLSKDSRQTTLDEWYAGSGELKRWLSYQEIDKELPTAVRYSSANEKSELLHKLMFEFARLNAKHRKLSGPVHASLSALGGRPAKNLPAIKHLPETSLIWVTRAKKDAELYTLIRNRRHSNVAFILGESLRYQPTKDSLSIVPGIATGYPNFIFSVPHEEVGDFVDALQKNDLSEKKRFVRNVINRWGVRRTSATFWDTFQSILDHHQQIEPLEAGILDINRYTDY